jgi:hypothetical protein
MDKKQKVLLFLLGLVSILLLSLLYTYASQLKEAKKPKVKLHDTALNNFGVWLWYLHHTNYKTHEELSFALANIGVKRIFIKVADGRDLIRWPELRKKSVPIAYAKNKIEAWAWSYNYPGNEALQAEALYYAAKYGYKSYIIDLEIEFDHRPEAAEALFKAFYSVKKRLKASGVIDSTFKIYCTTWGNPRDHGTPISTIDKYVDGFMPQTYVEVWGQNHLDNIPYWIAAGTNEYRELGCTKDICHVASTEYDKISVQELNQFLLHAGENASVWRIPGGAVPKAVWKDWEQLHWDQSFTDSLRQIHKFEPIQKDTFNKIFSVNYLGKFVKVKVLDSIGWEAKELKYNTLNTYSIHDLCKEKYFVEIYHNVRKTRHVLDLR